MWNILIVFNWLRAELVRSEYVAKLLLNGHNTDESLHTLKDCYCLREDNPPNLPKNIHCDYDFDYFLDDLVVHICHDIGSLFLNFRFRV